LSNDFGKSLTETFGKGIAEGKRFDDVLKGLRQSLVQFGLRAALQPLELSISRGLETLLSGLSGISATVGGDQVMFMISGNGIHVLTRVGSAQAGDSYS